MVPDLVSTHEASKIKAGATGREARVIAEEVGPAEVLARAGRMRPLSTAGALLASGEGRVAASLMASTQPLRDAAVIGFGLNAQIGASTSLYARYDGEITGRDDSHAISAGLRMTW